MTTVLLTRPEHSAEPIKSELESLGWKVLLQPTIEIRPPDSWTDVDSAIQRLFSDNRKDGFDYLVFSSINGVRFFFDRIQEIGKQLPFLPSVRLAAVGSGTDIALQQRTGCRADILPEFFSAEGVLEKLAEEASSGKRFLLLRANRGRDILRRRLEEMDGSVTEIVVYQSIDVKQPLPEISAFMRQGEIRYVTVTSSSIARSLVRMFGEELRRTELVSISPITSATLRELGFSPHYEAATASMEGIVEVFISIHGQF
jgi:uroporphyrinogen III methyltransferase/synthase